MFKTIINAWKIADLRKKMLFTALIVFIFRLGAALPVPFVNISGGLISDQNANNFMTYLSMMTGDAFNYGTLFAMSITPYINASIIIELLTVAIPALERLAKEGEEGRKKISTITRYSSVVLALMQSTAYYFYIRSQNYLSLDADGNKITVGRITIRNQKTRWGSCSSAGNVNFNYQLYYLPDELLDYVVVHELAHRRHMNHSKEFWSEVARYCPDYRARRKQLKEYQLAN